MNDNSVSLFKFHNNEIRVVMIGGDPWFVAVDVCLALSIHLRSDGRPNTSAALTKVDSTEKQTLTGSKVHRMNLTTSNRGITLISESGLYKLVMRSDKPEARHFQDWVTRDVLPAIRKDGGYIMGEEKVATGEMSDDELILRALQVAQNKIERLKAVVQEELDFMPVNKFLAHHDVYAGQPMRNRLAAKAKSLCESRGIRITKRQRFLPDGRETYANEYPHSVLIEAAEALNLQLVNNHYRPTAH